MVAAIDIRGLDKRYGALQALAGVDLEIPRGEFFGLLGPNGAGKTTLISILAGLARADAGSACVLGHDVVADYRAARRLLGVVPQELVFDPFFTVRETLAIQSGYYGLRDNRDWIDEVMHHLDLTAKADANMRTLSGGMKRRVLDGAGARASAAGDRPRRADRRRRCRAAAGIMGVRPPAQPRRPDRGAHDPLHRRGRATLRPHRDAQGRKDRRARCDADSSAASTHSYLRVRLEGACPGTATRRARRGGGEGGRHTFKLGEYAEVETALAELREAGDRILEMELVQPDLEEVFVQIMRGAGTPDAERRAHH